VFIFENKLFYIKNSSERVCSICVIQKGGFPLGHKDYGPYGD
jgi:hypothetical protein